MIDLDKIIEKEWMKFAEDTTIDYTKNCMREAIRQALELASEDVNRNYESSTDAWDRGYNAGFMESKKIIMNVMDKIK